MRTRRSWGAHLCDHTDAPHDDRGFGLSPTHSAQSRGDKDFPSQVLDAQVPPSSVEYSELQGRGWELTVHSQHVHLPPPDARHDPVSHHCAVDDSLGPDVAITARCHLAIPDHREGKQGSEPGVSHPLWMV